MTATDDSGASRQFRVVARLDGEIDVTYLAQGGVLQTVLRRRGGGLMPRQLPVATPSG